MPSNAGARRVPPVSSERACNWVVSPQWSCATLRHKFAGESAFELHSRRTTLAFTWWIRWERCPPRTLCGLRCRQHGRSTLLPAPDSPAVVCPYTDSPPLAVLEALENRVFCRISRFEWVTIQSWKSQIAQNNVWSPSILPIEDTCSSMFTKNV